MTKPTRNGCQEYNNLNRRAFLKGSAVSLSALMAAPAWMPRVAFAGAENSDRDVIISIYLRGGADGLTLCTPYFEDRYYALRPTISVPRPDSGDPNAGTALDDFFMLPPAMTGLLPAFDALDLCVVHACGSQDDTRSHFDAQYFMETGEPGNNGLDTGWLGRHILNSAPMDAQAVLRAASISNAIPDMLLGSPQTLPIPNPADFSLSLGGGNPEQRLLTLEALYANAAEPLKTSAENTQAVFDLLDSIDFENYVPAGGAVYPENDSLSRGLKATAALIKAEAGVEAIAMDAGSWDTHINQGSITGFMANNMQSLANSLGAFHADVIASGDYNVTVVVMSEFGRVAWQNGSGGTDHGHGGCMFVLGNNINGGQVITQWPGLEEEDLYEGQDLDVTIDYRDVLAEIVQNRLGNNNLATVFPNYAPTFQGITTV